MAGAFNDNVARKVSQGDVGVNASAWVPLTSSGAQGNSVGTTPMANRRHIRYQIKANPGGALALQYVEKNSSGSFTTPSTASVKTSTVIPGNSIITEPIGDSVQVFGRLVKKKGFTFNSIRVIVTEYA